jgi:hypothetical protein
MDKKRFLKTVHKDSAKQITYNPSRNSSNRKIVFQKKTNSSSSTSIIMINMTEQQKMIKQSSSNISHNQTNLSSNCRNTPTRLNTFEFKEFNDVIETKFTNIENKLINIKDILVLRDKRFDTIKELNNETLNNSLELSNVKKVLKTFTPLNEKFKSEKFEEIKKKSQERISVYTNLISQVKNQISDIANLEELSLSSGKISPIMTNFSENMFHKKRINPNNKNSSECIHMKKDSNNYNTNNLLNLSIIPSTDLESPSKNFNSYISIYQKSINQTKDHSFSSINRKKDGINNKHKPFNGSKVKKEVKNVENLNTKKNCFKTKNTSFVNQSFQKNRYERNKSVQENDIFKSSLLKDSFYELKNEEETFISNLPQTIYKTNTLKEVTTDTKKRRFFSQDNIKSAIKYQDEHDIKKEITTINEEDLESCYIPLKNESFLEKKLGSEGKNEKHIVKWN